MNDRIKYRYWKNKDWHNPNSELEPVYCNIVDGCDPTIAVSDFEFCTGLKDKNGKFIYEGDIVGFKDSIKYKVKYKPYSSCAFCLCAEKYCHTLDDDLASDCEVIGNIHENKDLLEANND